MEVHESIKAVRQWGREKGITGEGGCGNPQAQFEKLMEEAEELRVAIRDDNGVEKIDAIGDCTVVLILLADLLGIEFEECLLTAYMVISKRTGKMVNGQFVKDA
jgi:NTP pyrophosphatase (non-canonical NTP hydrolase)